MKIIPVSGPSITEKEVSYVADAVSNAWYENANMYHHRFEKAFAEYIGAKYAVSLPSCTSAIHLSLLALGIGEGDEVIVPDVTWIASAAPINYVRATPVFVDIDRQNWCLSTDAFESAITTKTKAVIPVDLYGNMPDMQAIVKIAKNNNIAIIEDAAEAFGSILHGKKAGAFGTTGVFSFHGSKTMTTGEGGMLVTDNEDIYNRVLFLRDHGRSPGDKLFNNTEVAYKYRMSSLQAALGLAQVERAEELIAKKRQIYSWYNAQLNNIPGIRLNSEITNGRNSYWMVTLLINEGFNMDKFTLIDKLQDFGIDSRPFFSPLSSLEAYQKTSSVMMAKHRNLVSYAISQYGINLPSGLNLTEQDVQKVTEAVRYILQA